MRDPGGPWPWTADGAVLDSLIELSIGDHRIDRRSDQSMDQTS